MYQNYNYYPQHQMPQQQQYYPQQNFRQAPPQIELKGKLVSSFEEVKAASIDFDGSIFYFPDLANKRIYTKQINMDGTAALCIYELKEFPQQKEESVVFPSVEKFVTREEFERVLAELRQQSINNSQTMPTQQKEKVEVMNF